ncbi:MAG TPA: non-canonical purine NTP pyrophosphatase [Terriglobia bacterium]|nr:non-canonical purine NTP pyrophosphatase [Terriglobia bacterium]
MTHPAHNARASLRLYLASSNQGKLREFRQAASGSGITVEQVPGIESFPECVEDGNTFEANARKKALHYAALSQGLVFADDSGISVDALSGAPGVYSARYSGPAATDESNNQKLIRDLRRIADSQPRGATQEHLQASAGARLDLPFGKFTAHYVCVIALAEAGSCTAITEGRVDGVIIESPRGEGGFGYDPYFFYPPFQKTFAEISAEEKFAVSHRGIAFRKLVDYLAARDF